MSLETIGYVIMQILPPILVFKAGKVGYGLATVFWSAGNLLAFFMR